MYKKYKPPLYSIPEKHESQDDLPANWIPKKKHEVLRVKYKCLKRLFKVYDSQINNLIEEYLKLRVNSEENIKNNPDTRKETSEENTNVDKEYCDLRRNSLEQSTTITNSLHSLNQKLQKCAIGPLIFEVIGDQLTDFSSRESLKLPKKSPSQHVMPHKSIEFKTQFSEEYLENHFPFSRHDLQVDDDALNDTNYDDFKKYFAKGMETSTQDLLESILACTQTSKSLFEEGNSIYLSRKLSLIQYLRRKLCNRNRPSTTKSDIIERETNTFHGTNSSNRATAVSEPIYDRRVLEPRKSYPYRKRGRRKIHFKHFNNRCKNRITSNQDLICEQSKIGDLSSDFEKQLVSDISPTRSSNNILNSLSFKASNSNEKEKNESNFYQDMYLKTVVNSNEFRYPEISSSTRNRNNTSRIQSLRPTHKIMYKCSFCHKEYKLKLAKDIHENTRHSFTKLVNRLTTFSKENDEPYFETALRKEPPIEILTPVIRRVRRYSRNKKSSEKRLYNNNEKKHYCKECDNIFPNREDLDFHLRLMHDISKCNVCKICSLHFESRSELTEHINQYHFGDESTCGSFYDYDAKSSSEENLFVGDYEQRKKREHEEFMKNRFRKYNSTSASSSLNTETRNRKTNDINYNKSFSQKSKSSPVFRRRNSTDSSDSLVSQKNRKFEDVKRDLKHFSHKSNIVDKKYLNHNWMAVSKMQSM